MAAHSLINVSSAVTSQDAAQAGGLQASLPSLWRSRDSDMYVTRLTLV